MPAEPHSTSWSAGWYADPWAPTGQRFWDGIGWTGQRVLPAPPEAPISDWGWHQWLAVAVGVLVGFVGVLAFIALTIDRI